MNNFNICYNALYRAFDQENVIIPLALVEILKPQNPVDSSIIHTNTNDDEAECRTTTSSEDFIDDESDGLDNIDSRNTNQANPKSRTNDKSADNNKNANSLNLPLSSLKLTNKPNPLDLPHDQKQRQEIDSKLNQLIFGIRQQKLKTKKKEIYELPPLIKQLIRCLYPSDIDDNNCSQKPDIVFTLRTFIELFRV
ncbi:unnamed protein product [Rotaria socialis]|uniref:Uncharacterized protein n=1 Tax=Rotaria socialis TaxID=392032 RepID=A0A821AU95_9BILA|nr:unnamed protein product [Rotaria socialis]CAF4430859.1 unnamed protein product [Rotaria socialis]CAF4581421.1 unnamed protein product [Rotaria socialis]